MKNTIIYKPHCSDCGELLHGTVSYHNYETKIDGRSGILHTYSMIAPMRCPKCGTVFETIVIPTGMPNGKFSYNADEYDLSVGYVY